MRVREKKTYDAQQWFRNGDHPDDECRVIVGPKEGLAFWSEGAVVRYYRNPLMDGKFECEYCHYQMHIHGWIDSGGDGQTVCPGDWIVRDGVDKYRAIPQDAFKLMFYED